MDILAEVLEAYRRCDVNLFPIDCLGIIKKLNIKAIPYSSLTRRKREALKEVSKDSYRIKNTIYYNDDRSQLVEGRIRFNLMHELGHIVLGHLEESEHNENCANWFAGEILAPTIIVYTCFTHNDEGAIVNSFNISNKAADTKIKICKAAGCNWHNTFIPPNTGSNFPFDKASTKIYNRFYDKRADRLVYSMKFCGLCGEELYNGEECTKCVLQYLKEGSRSMFDGEYLFG